MSAQSKEARVSENDREPAKDETQEKREATRSLSNVFDWDRLNAEWKNYFVQHGAPTSGLGPPTVFHELGRQSDLVEMIETQAEMNRWKERGEADVDLKDVAEKRVGELEAHTEFMHDLVGEKTRTIDLTNFLDRLAAAIDKEHKELIPSRRGDASDCWANAC